MIRGRHPDGATARTERIQIRLTPAGMAEVDRWRGTRTRSAFVRDAVAAHCRMLAEQQILTESSRRHG